MIVGENDAIHVADAEPSEGRRHQPFTEINGRTGQPAAIDQVTLSGKREQRGVTLPDAQGCNLQFRFARRGQTDQYGAANR